MSTIPVEHDETLSLILRCRTLTQYLGIDETVAIILNEGVDEESARLCATAGEMAAAWHSLHQDHSSVIQKRELCQFLSRTLGRERDVTLLVFSLTLVTLNHGPRGSLFLIMHGELSSLRGEPFATGSLLLHPGTESVLRISLTDTSKHHVHGTFILFPEGHIYKWTPRERIPAWGVLS